MEDNINQLMSSILEAEQRLEGTTNSSLVSYLKRRIEAQKSRLRNYGVSTSLIVVDLSDGSKMFFTGIPLQGAMDLMVLKYPQLSYEGIRKIPVGSPIPKNNLHL